MLRPYTIHRQQRPGFLPGWLFCLIFLFGSLSTQKARATHIVGGELGLTHLSVNEYQITLDLYFDAVNGSTGAIDDTAHVYIYGKSTNSWKGIYSLPRVGSTLVPYTSIQCTVGSLKTKHL